MNTSNKELFKKLKCLKRRGLCLVINKNNNHDPVNYYIIEHLIKNLKSNGIYITINKPCSSINSDLKKRDINLKNLYYIDLISKNNKINKRAHLCTLLKGPGSLTELSILFNDIANTGVYHFVFLDSISDLLRYNDDRVIRNFMDYLISKIKILKLTAVFISRQDKNSRKLIKKFSHDFDRIISI